MLLSLHGWTSHVHPVPIPGERGCVKFGTKVFLSGLSLHSGLIYSFILCNAFLGVDTYPGHNKDLWWSQVLPNVKDLSIRLPITLIVQSREKVACVEGCL